MPQVRPMLDDTELQQVQTIDVDGDQVLLRHSIPALEGDFLQRLNRRASRIRLSGVLTGATARDDLKTLRDKYRDRHASNTAFYYANINRHRQPPRRSHPCLRGPRLPLSPNRWAT